MDNAEADKSGRETADSAFDEFQRQRAKIYRNDYEANPNLCLYCTKELPFEKRRNKFCNQSCSASYNNIGVTRHIKRSRVCSCGKPKLLANKYCSDCAAKHVYHRKQSVEELKDSVAIRRLLIEQRGHQCEDCGLAEWKQQLIPLELHHVNGDSDNNTAANLQLLCPNCHAFTAHYKGAVKGKNGSRQQRRRKKYANGEAW
jgi:hypothetical protein